MSVDGDLRPIAIGRRNGLFAGCMRGGRDLRTHQANVDMVGYLADVMVRVATHPASKFEQLLPANWVAQVAPQSAELALA